MISTTTFTIAIILYVVIQSIAIWHRMKSNEALENIGHRVSERNGRYMSAIIGKDTKIRELEKLGRDLYIVIDNKSEAIKDLENKIQEINRDIRKNNKSIYAPWIHKDYNYAIFGDKKVYLYKDKPSALIGHVFNFIPDDSIDINLNDARKYYKVDKDVTYKIIRK